jgi:GNAT superfamily N-acetyltransferase
MITNVYSIARSARVERMINLDLTAQGCGPDHPMRGVFGWGSHYAIARNEQWEIVGAISYEVEPILEQVDICHMRVLEQRRGIGHQLIAHLAVVAGDRFHGDRYTIVVHSAVESAVPFYAKTGADFANRCSHVGTWPVATVRDLRDGRTPTPGYVAPNREGAVIVVV